MWKMSLVCDLNENKHAELSVKITLNNVIRSNLSFSLLHQLIKTRLMDLWRKIICNICRKLAINMKEHVLFKNLFMNQLEDIVK